MAWLIALRHACAAHRISPAGDESPVASPTNDFDPGHESATRALH